MGKISEDWTGTVKMPNEHRLDVNSCVGLSINLY
jgi:hypothetical protein